MKHWRSTTMVEEKLSDFSTCFRYLIYSLFTTPKITMYWSKWLIIFSKTLHNKMYQKFVLQTSQNESKIPE